MNADRFRQIDEIFAEVLEVPKDERAAFLSEKCGTDAELRAEVLSLLQAEAEIEADRFMEHSAMNLMARKIAGEQESESFDLSGRLLGIYRIEKQIGAGGMGEVYLATDTELDRPAALKLLPAEFSGDTERIRRFERESRAVSALNHPNIVTVFGIGSADRINYLATEFVEGKTVRELIDEGPKLKQTLAVISQTCEALAAAHAAGIIHRDIKPENIMRRPDGYVKVLDFGLAKLTAPSDIRPHVSTHTQKGIIIGTPSYMSPMQVAGEKIDYRTDLWSLGVILYEMLAGKNPFRGATRRETFQKILGETPPPVSETNPELPAELDRILAKALEKDPDTGYQTASDLRADLRRVRREIDSSPSLRSGATTPAQKRAKKFRRRFLTVAGGAAVLFMFGLGIWFFVKLKPAAKRVDWNKATTLQLTDQPGLEFFPSLAPDGKSYVYAAQTGERFDLLLQRTGGKNAINLTENSKADDTQPAFSPDGERIAFRSERNPAGIYVMEATGENVRRVADFGYHPAWSPDGKEIVVSTEGRTLPNVRNTTLSELWIISLETGAKRLLVKNDSMQPAWSPDGRLIAYWFYPPNAGRRDIAVISKDGGEARVVTKDGTTNWNPVWSPDGQYLYFASDRSGNMNFWRIPFDAAGQVAGEPEAVVTPSKYSRHLAFSRDGNRLIYVSTDQSSNIQAVDFDPKTEKIAGAPFWVTRGDRLVSLPELSPDGTRFLMRVPRRAQDDIATVNRDGSDWRDITDDAAFDRYPRWSPDGRTIAFTSDRSGIYEIYLVNADGTNLRQITFGPPHSTFPLFSPDGKRLIFRRNQRNYILDLEKDWATQTPSEIPLPKDSSFVAWDWSPDGRFLAGTFRADNRTLGFYSFETDRYEQIPGTGGIPMWIPDSRRFLFADEGKVFVADRETKKVREIVVPLTQIVTSVRISRDSRLLYFTVISNESNIWLLDNLPAQ